VSRPTRPAYLIAAAACLALFADCDNSASGPDLVASVSVTPASVTVAIGHTIQLLATPKNAAGGTMTDRPVTWVSSTPAVATISPSGLATGMTQGAATITATSEGKTGTAAVTVVLAAVETVSVSPQTVSVGVGDTARLVATLKDADGAVLTGRSVTWTSGDAGVAQVSGTGLVSGMAPGTTTISATCEGKTGTATVDVKLATPTGVVISSPQLLVGTAAAAAFSTGSESDSVIWFSMPPDTAVHVQIVTIRNRRTTQQLVAPVRDGGIDPVPLTGAAGDTIQVLIGNTLDMTVVPGNKPPVVIRTQPPARKTDVPLNAALLVYFSEPVEGGTILPPSIQLMQAGTPVSGSVRFADSAHVSVAFVPGASLTAGVEYQLIVSTNVRGSDGESLVTPDTVSFTTGSATTGSAASIQMAVTAINFIGTTYQMIATVRDAAGNVLTGQPVVWATSDSAGLAASVGGLLTSHIEGNYRVTASLVGCCFAFNDSIYVRPGPPATVTIAPSADTVPQGDTILLQAIVRDALGHQLRFLSGSAGSVTWKSDDAAVATASTDGYSDLAAVGAVVGVAPGIVTITATDGAASGTATVTVGPPRPVASVVLNPATATLVTQGTLQLVATVTDSNGKAISLAVAPLSWQSDNAGVATVDANGLVTGVAAGVAQVSASSGGHADTAIITVHTITLASVTAGGGHACGLDSSGAAYCWGGDVSGELGDGRVFATSTLPVAVLGGISFAPASLTAGDQHTCGLTAAGLAYCWGQNSDGQVGNGTDFTGPWSEPELVSGNLTFASISAGGSHTCGITTGGQAYCWGDDAAGQLGDGSFIPEGSPVPVAGGLTFTAISAGMDHTCGLTTSGDAYCWGGNDHGQLGTGSNDPNSPVPVPVAGAMTFTAVDAGEHSSCGLVAGGAAYCWGWNGVGGLGNGSLLDSHTPVAVAWGQPFTSITNSWGHACGISGGATVCWGFNHDGQLGNGTTTNSPVPIGVAGGVSFASVSAGLGTCGISTGGLTYCWGDNATGEIGDGSLTSKSVPTKVLGQP
jgi:alpha-tubulin suppressor-like RCC1 family protein